MEAPKLCVICCVPFTSSKTRRDFGSVQKLKAVCSGHLTTAFGSPRKLSLFGCPKCVTCVISALESKEKVNEVEEGVWRLQLQILKLKRKVVKMLRELEGNIAGFKEEVKGLEGILEEGGERMRRMDGFYGEEDTGQDLLKEGIQFREKIVTLKGELNEFSRKLEIKSFGIKASSEETQQLSDEAVIAKVNKDDPCQEEVEDKTEEAEFSEGNNQQEVQDEVDVPWSPEGDNGSSSDDDNDGFKDNGQPMSPKSEQLPKKKQIRKKKCEEYTDLKSMFPYLKIKAMSRYKRNVISHFAQQVSRDKQLHENDPTSAFNAIDPLNHYPMTCDPSTSQFTMGGITLKINEKEKLLQCLKCGEKMRAGFGQFVYSHVLGSSHMDVLQCPFCHSKISDYLRFRDHVKGLHEGRYPCDICGKPLGGLRYLKVHKWSHMNQEEKEEALKSGQWSKPPGATARKTGNFQCATCGKTFLKLDTFKRHEKTHLNTQHICPKCGKDFKLKNLLGTHQRLYCFMSEKERQLAKRFHCDLCPMKFKQAAVLQVHKNQVHLNIRPFCCGQCGKTFKRGPDLRIHEGTHGDERPFKCRREGCEATFKTRNSTTKHEKRCGK